MGFYSFIVHSPAEIPLPEYLIYLDPGQNVFNVTLNDYEGFVQRLADEGVKVIQANRLDEFEQLDPLDIDLDQDPFNDEPPPILVPGQGSGT